MTTLREAAQQALEALEYAQQNRECPSTTRQAITDLRAALAQEQAETTQDPAPQPGVWMHPWPPVRAQQAEPAQEPVATTQQPVVEKPPSDYRRGYWDGFAIGKREGRIEAEDAAKQAEPKGGGNLPPPLQAEPVAWLQPKTVDAHLRPDLGYETCSSADYGAFPVYRVPPKAEPVQEPVASLMTHVQSGDVEVVWNDDGFDRELWHETPLYTAPPLCSNCASLEAQNDELDRKLAEMERAEPMQGPVAWMLTDADNQRVKFLEWQKETRGYSGVWIKTPLYTAPPQRKPLSGLEVERLLEQVIGSLPAARNLVRAVERAHGIGRQMS